MKNRFFPLGVWIGLPALVWLVVGGCHRETSAPSPPDFEITRPLEEIRKEALEAEPPREEGDFRRPDLVDLSRLSETIRLDIRYATRSNFLGAVFYSSPRAFLQRPAAEALLEAHEELRDEGLGLWIFDAYRPWFVTKMFWDATPERLKNYVGDPAKGSRHNRGCAVDLTLYDLRTGHPLPMPSDYDDFSVRAHPDYPGGTAAQRRHRDRLIRLMERHGFSVYPQEWWHFDHHLWEEYPILNLTFDEIGVEDGM